MEETCVLRPIAHVHSEFPGKFGIPRQSGVVPELRSELIFTPEFRNPDALRGIEGFDRLWLIWEFSANRRASWSPTVRPPRLGGNLLLRHRDDHRGRGDLRLRGEGRKFQHTGIKGLAKA